MVQQSETSTQDSVIWELPQLTLMFKDVSSINNTMLLDLPQELLEILLQSVV